MSFVWVWVYRKLARVASPCVWCGQVNESGEKMLVKFDDGTEKWLNSDSVRVVRPMKARGGVMRSICQLHDTVCLPLASEEGASLVQGSLKEGRSLGWGCERFATGVDAAAAVGV